MTVAAILQRKGHDVVTVSPKARVPEIAHVLAMHRIGAVLVKDAADQALGMVSERDLVRAMARDGAAVLEMTAAQLMSADLYTITADTTVAQAMSLMTVRRVRHLPVVQDGEMLGLVSIGDVVLARLGEQAEEVDGLKAYVNGFV